ncbi:MAG: hypothetical protein IJI06_08600 [Oscillospiraceae bacterium]|nr:hypothetical protein [Oscillospiraceae bacterium]
MKRILCVLLACSLAFSLCGCGHKHTWVAATCTEAKTCSECGETEGEALGHDWTEATCTEPKTCTRCGETSGEALGHDLQGWITVKEPSCSEVGTEKGTCSRCGEESTRDIPKTDHTPSDWVVVEEPTFEKDGKRVRQCSVCGEEVESERFSIPPEEREKEYKSQCKTISYTDLQRDPGTYKGSYVKITGVVFQIINEATSSQYYSAYFVKVGSNIYLVYVDNYGTGKRILEKDRINVWGEVGDLYTYTTVRGNSNIVPTIYAEYYG